MKKTFRILSVLLCAAILFAFGSVAAFAEDRVIDSVAINGVVRPENMNSPVFKTYSPNGGFKIDAINWVNATDNVWLTEDSEFETGKTYSLFVYISADEGYSFSSPTATIDGETAEVRGVDLQDPSDYLCVCYDFVATEYKSHSFGDWEVVKKAGVDDGEEICVADDDPDFWMSRRIPAATDGYTTKDSYTYTGKTIKPSIVIYDADGYPLKKGVDYLANYPTSINPGHYTIDIKYIGKYQGGYSIDYTIRKAKNPIIVKPITKTVKYSAVKKKAAAVAPLSISKAQGTLSYKKVSGSSKLTVNAKTGKVTVKKGTKKGTYKVKIKVTVSGTSKYGSASKAVIATVKVK